MPIVTEYIWRILTREDISNSVHLQNYPLSSLSIDTTLADAMSNAQTIVRM
jgi:valyl-tRNA synthetase